MHAQHVCADRSFVENVWTYLITMSANSHQKVVRLDVSMDEVLVVDIFYSTNHLGEHEHKDCF